MPVGVCICSQLRAGLSLASLLEAMPQLRAVFAEHWLNQESVVNVFFGGDANGGSTPIADEKAFVDEKAFADCPIEFVPESIRKLRAYRLCVAKSHPPQQSIAGTSRKPNPK
jgi:hypothetical protein